jgi:hypothetical protein
MRLISAMIKKKLNQQKTPSTVKNNEISSER